jgi:plastocyanin
MTRTRLAGLALAAILLLAACGGGGDTSTSEPAETGGGETGGASTELTVTAEVNASNDGFVETSLSAPADTAFTITFVNNDDGIPHNVQIFEGTDTTATPVWAPDGNALITGPDTAVYEVPALPAGTYTYNCYSHPATMVGTLTVA